MKKVLGVFAGLVVLFFAAIVIIPMVVDVDKYRPQIIQTANENLNGTLELGKLSLSLWGKVHVGIDGLRLKDGRGQEVVQVKDASFTMPYFSILSGSPLVTLSMKQPEINVIKTKDGKMNVTSLMKQTPSNSAAAPTSSPSASESNSTSSPGNQKVQVPGIVAHSHIGVFIENAKLVYKDEGSAISSTINDFNFRVKDFSLSRTTELEIWADLKTTVGKDVSVQGPLKLLAELKPEISGGEFKSATVIANFTADDLEIQKGTLFHKAKGDATHFKFNGTLTQDSLKLTEATATFHNAEITVTGEYHKDSGANILFNSKPVDLKSWSDLIPLLKEYELEGQLTLNGFVKGKPEALAYQATLGVKNFSAKGPNLKAKPVINGEIEVTPDQIEKIVFDLKGPGNDIKLNAKVTSFTKPQIQFTVRSDTGMDLDQWIEFPKKSEAKAAAPSTASAGSGAATGGAAQAEDADASLDSLRKNEMARETVVDGDINISFLKAQNVRIDNIAAKVQFKNLVFSLQNIGLKVFDGVVKGGFSTDLKPAHPDYNMKFSVSGMEMSKAVESQFQSFKDTMSGKLTATAEGGGSSFNPELAKKKLQMKGKFELANAQFKTIDIAKAVNDALNSSVSQVGDKVPGLKGKKLSMSSNGGTLYEMVSSNFTIQNGILDAPDFFAKPAPKRGIDLKGSTKMGLVDESLDAKWEVTDSQHITGADQVNVDIGGKTIKNVLAKGENDPVTFPIKVGCKWSAPCASYSDVPQYLANIAIGRVSKGAGEAAKQKAVEAIQQKVGGQAGQQIGNGLKKLFGH